MSRYKIKYRKECEHIMEVYAHSEEEAREKFKDFDCIRDYEVQGISEEIIKIERDSVK